MIRALLLLALLAPAMIACGKKGEPTAPGPQDQVTWPRAYPAR